MTEEADNTKKLPAVEEKPKARKKPPAAGIGRPKGVPNKITRDLRAAIIKGTEIAGAKVGGKEDAATYFAWLAENNSTAHAGLVAKILPQAGPNDDGSHKVVHEIVRKIVAPDN